MAPAQALHYASRKNDTPLYDYLVSLGALVRRNSVARSVALARRVAICSVVVLTEVHIVGCQRCTTRRMRVTRVLATATPA